MAVPPAPDGDAVGDPGDSTDTHTDTDSGTHTGSGKAADGGTAPGRPLWILVALFAVVLGCLLASVVALGRAGWSVDELTEEPTNPQQQREQLMTVASSFVTRLDTYGPADLDDADKLTRYVDRVEELMTAKAFSLFERGVPIIEVSVAQSRYSSKSEVYDTGVAEMDDDSARVLVAGTVVLSGADEKRKRVVLDSRTFRFEVALIRSGGEWLVDDYGTVGTLDQPVELPPTDAPAPSGAPSPTGEGGQQ